MKKVGLPLCQPFILLLAAVVAFTGARPAEAYKPNDPEVQEIVIPGIKFLESRGATYERLGGTALIGLVMYKQTHDEENPLLLDSIRIIRQSMGHLDPKNLGKDNIYDIGLMLILLAEVNPTEYASEIECLLENLKLRQKDCGHNCGGWGYDRENKGDTSMTQYGVLSYWTALQKGFDIPPESIEAAAVWLLRTQDPNGQYGYKGRVAPTFEPVPQGSKKHSLTAAGLGSVYICADMLGLKSRGRPPKEKSLSPGFKRVEIAGKEPEKKEAEKKKRFVKSSLSSRHFYPVQNRGNGWFAKNYRIDPEDWTYYYIYALERYMSFRELAEGRVGSQRITEPKWYNDGVIFLKSTQKKDGSWNGQSKTVPATCFALLFLLRSSGQTISEVNSFGDGALMGGRGIPKDTDNLEVRGGAVVERPLLGPAQELMNYLQNDDQDVEASGRILRALPELPPTELQAITRKYKDIIYQLAEHQTGEARRTAVQTMGKSRDFDYVPILIYVLMTDPDKDIAREARDVLRHLARKPKGFGMPDKPVEAERRTFGKAWKEWYLAVRPDAEFKDRTP